ncbi:MAG: MFS transporter, partial [Roseovarius sp.]|nr:MFS transporter [Roseovarius sp.]
TAGVLTTAVFLGQILSPLLTLPLLQAVGFTGMFATLAAVLILAALAGLALHLGRARRILPG